MVEKILVPIYLSISSFEHIVNGQESKLSKLWSIAIGASKKM